MAAIRVSIYDDNHQIGQSNGRVIVRTSAGIPYVVSRSISGISCQLNIWKGDSVNPTSFSKATLIISTSSYSTLGYSTPSAAIDSSGVIHIVWQEDNGATPSLMYCTFSTSEDRASTPVDIVADMGADMTQVSNMHVSIAIDSNDIPHVAYVAYVKVGGSTMWMVLYQNRIGGAWNASGIEIEGTTAGKNCRFPNIAIGLLNIPIITYSNETDNDVTIAIGNQNDASSFTLYDVDADHETSSGTNYSSLCIDSRGDAYIAFRDESDTYIYLAKYHIGGSTILTRRTNSKNGINPTIVANGNYVYLFYEEDTDNDIVYDRHDWINNTWLGETTLETGTYNYPKVKCGFWVDNSSTGISTSGNFIATNTAVTDSENILTGKKMAQSFTANGTTLKSISIKSLDAPGGSAGGFSISVYNHSGTYGTSSVPTGSALATSETLADSQVKLGWTTFHFTGANQIPLTNNAYYVFTLNNNTANGLITFRSASSTASGNYASDSTGSWVANSSYDMAYIITSLEHKSLPELDYCFVDETATPDVWFNTLILNNRPTVALNTPTNNATNQKLLPDLAFTGSDTESDQLEYNIQIAYQNFPTAAVLTTTETFNGSYGLWGGTASEYNQAIGQALTPSTSFILDAVAFFGKRQGFPTDNIFVEVRTGSFTGTVVATSDNLPVTSIPDSSDSPDWNKIYFTNRASLTSGVAYYIIFCRTGAYSNSDYAQLFIDPDNPYASSDLYTKYAGTWTLVATGYDCLLKLYDYYLVGSYFSSIPDATFTDVTDGTDTHPFDAGDQIKYTVQSNLTVATDYFWRVRAFDIGYGWGAWTSAYKFTTGTIPVVTLNSPSDEAIDQSLTPALRFTGTDTVADTLEYMVYIYDSLMDLQVMANSATDAGFLDITDGTDTHPFDSGDQIQYTVQSALDGNSIYYWKVCCVDNTANVSAWTDLWQFTTIASTNWTAKPLKVYLGGSWQTKPLKAYVGGAWTTKSLKKNI